MHGWACVCPQEVFNARNSIPLCSYIELMVQRWAKQQPGLVPLWVRDGQGACHGVPAYKVGMHLIPHLPGGSLPAGYIHTVDPAPTMG